MSKQELFDILHTQYLPALLYCRSKNTRYAKLTPVEYYPLIFGCDNIGSDLATLQELYHPIMDFYDSCLAGDGHDWIYQTVGLNRHYYQLLKLRYWLMRAIGDYRRVHHALPEDAVQYSINVLTGEFPTDECRSTF